MERIRIRTTLHVVKCRQNETVGICKIKITGTCKGMFVPFIWHFRFRFYFEQFISHLVHRVVGDSHQRVGVRDSHCGCGLSLWFGTLVVVGGVDGSVAVWTVEELASGTYKWWWYDRNSSL